MRTALPLLLLFLFTGSPEPAKTQNLIPDPGVEMMTACPDNIAFLDDFLEHWFTVRQPTVYWHPCQDTLPLNGGWNNMFGYQEPLMGDGYIAAATYRVNPSVTDNRACFATMLNNPLEIGEEYHISFHVSMAYRPSVAMWATNNLGFLLMTENYLDPAFNGANPNFAHYTVENIITDTTNWVQLHGSIIADSAYTMIAFGNFFDSEYTEIDTPFDENITTNSAYYFYDGFCVSEDPADCGLALTTQRHDIQGGIKIFPMPAHISVQIRSDMDDLVRLGITDIHGRLLRTEETRGQKEHSIHTEDLPQGIYLLHIETEAGVVSRKLVVQHP